MKRIIVCGTRSFEDYKLMTKVLDKIIKDFGEDVEIVSGHATGADSLGERYAKEHNLKCCVFEANWEKHGKKAGFLRNSQMLDYGSEIGIENALVVAFWDGVSRGSLDTMKKAQRLKMPTKVCLYVPEDGVPVLIDYVYQEI